MKPLDIKLARRIFTEYLKNCGYSRKTLQTKSWAMDRFETFLYGGNYPTDLREVQERDIREYCRYLDREVSISRKSPLSEGSKTLLIRSVTQLFQSLYKAELILINPARHRGKKKQVSHKPRDILTREEIACFLESIKPEDPCSRQDRALFELIYSSGLRAGEAARLKLEDMDFDKRMLLIREGKFRKDRYVPLSRVALSFLKAHIGRRRKGLVFMSRSGPLNASLINYRFKKRLKQSGLAKQDVSVHSIRHSIATHLLEEGANIRYVQELLGHESLDSTMVYTHTVTESLKRTYKVHHPRENEYYKEAGVSYIERLETFRAELILRNEDNKKRRLKKLRCKELKDRSMG